jgi:hypothetical protein
MIVMSDAEKDPVQLAFAIAQRGWREALEAHRLAPPDGGFSARLAALSGAARIDAKICREAHAAGYEWPPHRGAGKPPWELQGESGRRGPEDLWRVFDSAVLELNRASTTTDLLEIARAYEVIGDAAADLAEAIRREDLTSGLLPKARAGRRA